MNILCKIQRGYSQLILTKRITLVLFCVLPFVYTLQCRCESTRTAACLKVTSLKQLSSFEQTRLRSQSVFIWDYFHSWINTHLRPIRQNCSSHDDPMNIGCIRKCHLLGYATLDLTYVQNETNSTGSANCFQGKKDIPQ